MRRPDLDVIAESQDLVVQRVVEHGRHLLGRESATAREIGASGVADEQRVAREQFGRRVFLFITDEPRHAFGRMAGRFQSAQHDTAGAQLVAVTHRAMRKLRVRGRADDDLRAAACGELLMSADKVGVQMGLDDVADAQPGRARRVEILLDVALRIDDHGLPVGADQIRRMGETSEVELAEVHGADSTLRAAREGLGIRD